MGLDMTGLENNKKSACKKAVLCRSGAALKVGEIKILKNDSSINPYFFWNLMIVVSSVGSEPTFWPAELFDKAS